jgi:glycosyltransferase involved in cell wall biosynthesis
MVDGLTKKGVIVSLVELGEYTPPAWLHTYPGVRYFNLGVSKRSHYPIAVLRLASLLKKEKPDILHSHLYFAGLIAVLTKLFQRRSRVCLMRHHSEVVRMLGTRLHTSIDRWMAERADHVVTVSEATRQYMRTVDGIKCEIDVVNIGFDFEIFSPNITERNSIRREFNFDDETFVVGYAATFAPGKGHIQLVEAFGLLEKDIPRARLFLVGEGRLAEVDNAIQRLGISEKVTFTGWRDDVAACMNAMDAFVLPSLSESFSQVLIEAMGVGLPVISTKVGIAEEVVIDGENGLLVNPSDINAISKKLKLLFNQPNLRHKMGKAARESVTERFSVDRMVEEQYALYQKWVA